MPQFYMPWPARRSPHVDAVREHTMGWLGAMGMFEPGNAAGWSEERMRRADIPLLIALVHPDADRVDLEQITDFYTWSFFVDDAFVQTFTRMRDRAAGKAYLARLGALLEPVGAPQPDDADPAERGLADVWARLAPRIAPALRERLRMDVLGTFDCWLWEVAAAAEERLAEPIDYVEMRRLTVGGYWGIDLILHTLRIELPARIAGARPVRVLDEVFCDTIALRNDIISLRKEVAEGETNNGVLVVEAALGYGTQRAVDLVNDVVTARLQLAEHVIATELAPLMELHALGLDERASLLTYVQGLRDGMAGDFQWEIGSGRYHGAGPVAWLPAWSPVAGSVPIGPNAVGSAAARLGLHGRMLGVRARSHAPLPDPAGAQFEPPPIAMPHPARCHPAVDALRHAGRRWAGAMGMIDPGGWRVWDSQRFDEMDLALFTASTHPDATADDLVLVHDWDVWGFYFDDFFVVHHKRTGDVAGARVLVERLALFTGDASPPLARTPVERGLADLWARSAGTIADGLRSQLAAHVHEFADSFLWELDNLVARRVPEPVDYAGMRRRTARSAFASDLVRHALRVNLPPSLADARAMRVVEDTVADATALHNDLLSYTREAAVEDDCNNGVLVLARFLDCAPAEGAGVVARLIASRLCELDHALTIELPLLLDEHPDERADAERYAAGLRDRLAGAHAWSSSTGRHRADARRRRELGPTGLGTAAARVGAASG